MSGRRYSDSFTDEEAFASAVVDDLLAGVNEWKTVPDIVKLTFKALSDVVRAQGICLAEVQRTLAVKASKAEVQAMHKAVAAETVKALADNRWTADDRLEAIGRGNEAKTADRLIRDLLTLQTEVSDLRSELRTSVSRTVTSEATLEILDSKADKTAVATALHRKANKLDTDLALEAKADKVHLHNLQVSLDIKADRVLLDNLTGELKHKADKADLERVLRTEVAKLERSYELRGESGEGLDHRWASVAVEIDNFMTSVKGDIEMLEKLTKAELLKKADSRELDRLTQLLAHKADSEHLDVLGIQLRKEMRQSSAEDSKKSALKLVRDTTETLQRSEDKFQKFEDEMKVVRERIKRDAQRAKSEIDESFKLISQHQAAAKNDTATELTRLRTDQDRLAKQVRELKAAEAKKSLEKKLQGKADVTEVSEALGRVQKDTAENLSELKAEFKRVIALSEKEIVAVLERKANTGEVKEWLASKADIESLEQALASPQRLAIDALVTKLEFSKYVEASSKAVADLNKEVVLRSNIKDVCALLDSKANIDEVNAELRELKRQNSNSLAEEFERFKEGQVQLNELMFGEACVIRLIWSSGLIRKDGRVVWDALNFNSCPENFEWEDDIVAEAPGLYEVYWCFYSRQVQEVVLCVNGLPVCAVTEDRPFRHVSPQWYGKICGASYCDYVSLPAKAHLSLLYKGDSEVEGFIGLKKL
jgi:hypothetical protein